MTSKQRADLDRAIKRVGGEDVVVCGKETCNSGGVRDTARDKRAFSIWR